MTEEQEQIILLIYEKVEGDLDYRVKLDIEGQLVAKLLNVAVEGLTL